MGKLGPGDIFGKTALLTGDPRNATAVAAEKLEVYSLGKTNFDAVVMASSSFEEELRKVLFSRQ